MTTTSPYVICERYCGKRLYEPGALAHDEQCGAPADEILRLNTLLAELRITGAVAEAVEAQQTTVDPIPTQAPTATPGFVCTCRASFWIWEDLAQHQESTGHDGCAVDEDDETTVDGERATINHDKPKGDSKPGDYAQYWKDPAFINDADIFVLQARIDNGQITIGGMTAGKACAGKQVARIGDGSDLEISCPHRCFMRTVRTNTCDLEHNHQETLEQFCLIHAITALGGGRAPAGNGPLFGTEA